MQSFYDICFTNVRCVYRKQTSFMYFYIVFLVLTVRWINNFEVKVYKKPCKTKDERVVTAATSTPIYKTNRATSTNPINQLLTIPYLFANVYITWEIERTRHLKAIFVTVNVIYSSIEYIFGRIDSHEIQARIERTRRKLF